MASVLFDDVRGDDWNWVLQALEYGSEIPVTGLAAASAMVSKIRRYVDDTVVATASAVEVLDDTNGYFQVTFTAASTASVTPGDYWCSVRFTVDGKKRTAGPFGVRIRGGMD